MATRKKPPPDPPPKRRGRPPGRKDSTPREKRAGKYNVSLPLDLIEWLKAHPDGPAAVAARALRSEMERERRTSKK